MMNACRRSICFAALMLLMFASARASLAQGGGAEKPKTVTKPQPAPSPTIRRQPTFTRRPRTNSTPDVPVANATPSTSPSSVAPANTVSEVSRVALVNTSTFYDQLTGINRLTVALKLLDSEFQPRRDELQQIQARLKLLSGSSKDELQREYDQKSRQAQDVYDHRLRDVTSPINEDISKALDTFAKQNGLNAIFDVSKLNSGVLTSSETIDVTNAFVAAFNSANSAASISIPRVSVPTLKVAIINTEAFSDENRGIARYIRTTKALDAEFKPRSDELSAINNRIQALTAEVNRMSGSSDARAIQAKVDETNRLKREIEYKNEQARADFQKRYNELVAPINADIGKELEGFARQRGLTLVIDVTKFADSILSVSNSIDITRDFTSEYNARNP